MPETIEQEQIVKVNMTMSQNDKERLVRLAKARRTSLSGVVRQLAIEAENPRKKPRNPA